LTAGNVGTVRYEWRLIEAARGVGAVADTWRSLHGDAGLYARFEWHHAVVSHLLPHNVPHYVEILDGPRVVAIVPVFRDAAETPILGKVRAASSGFHSHIGFFDFPVAPGVSWVALAQALQHALAEIPLPHDAVVWRRLDENGNALKVARAFADPRASLLPWMQCTVIDTARSYDAVLESISKNLRANLRKGTRKLQESGAVTVSRESGLPAGDPAARERAAAAFETFVQIEASGWKGEAGTASAISLNPGVRAFYEELLASASASFLPEIAILWSGAKALAVQFALQVKGTKHVLKVGYDEDARRQSPGHLLLSHIVEAACKEGVHEVNLVIEQPWHDVWRPRRQEAYSCVRFRNRAKGALLGAYLMVKPLIRRQARAAHAQNSTAD